MSSAFWDDLAEDLKDPEFLREFLRESIRITVIDRQANGLDCDPSDQQWYIDDKGRLWAEITDLDTFLDYLQEKENTEHGSE